MYVRLLVAALAVVAVPMAVSGQQPASPRKAEPKRYCAAYSDIQSRLSGRRRCHSKVERDQLKHEARQVVDRIQTMKATSGH